MAPASWLVALATAVIGVSTALYYARLGLILSHYDARAHLVVARRIIDNLTPCWEQIGAVWLPLPHLLNALPVQVDAWYRSGASASAISIASFAITASAIFVLARQLTDSHEAGLAAAAIVALNPNLLYLQATPMTEPLLLALTTTALVLSIEAARHPAMRSTIAAGVCLGAACLTRYEAWPVAAAAILLMAYALVRPGTAFRDLVCQLFPMAAIPLAAMGAFCLHSKLSTGAWLVSGGFYVPENEAAGKATTAAIQVWWGTHVMTGSIAIYAAVAGVAGTIVRALGRSRDRCASAIALALIAAAALPAYAFYQGHPFRIRYMAVLIPAAALFAAAAVGAFPQRRRLFLAVLLVATILEKPPWWSGAPMVREAQWDVAASRGRQAVSAYLAREYDGALIMASMGSLGHYMQELSRVSKPATGAGFRITDFLHEGNGDIWTAALDDPAPHAGWLLVDEYSEGGDLLAALARTRPAFLDAFTRVAGGGGVVLYRLRTGTRTIPAR